MFNYKKPKMNFTKKQIDRASMLLSGDGDAKEMLIAIKAQSEIDGTVLIDYVDGVTPIESAEFSYTCNEFIELI